MRVLVTGATGFVGRALVPVLLEAGHEVRAMTRNPGRYAGGGEPVHGDVDDPRTLPPALEGCDAALYLVHGLGHADFVRRDAAAATAFAAAAGAAGLRRIVYLGGLGDDEDDLSPHLRSRREVERLLATAGVPVTALRAGVVVGDGGISWELLRQLVVRLPAMVTPRWVRVRTQPVAVDDAVRYLAGVLEPAAAEGRVFEIGGAAPLTYEEMLLRAAAVMGRSPRIVPVPLLTPRLSSYWLALVSGDVDVATARTLIDSMANEVVVRDSSIRTVVPGDPLDYEEMVRRALAARERRLAGVA